MLILASFHFKLLFFMLVFWTDNGNWDKCIRKGHGKSRCFRGSF